MKGFLVLCALVAVAAARDIGYVREIDYSTVKPIYEMPGFIARFPFLKGMNALSQLSLVKTKNNRIVGGNEAAPNSIAFQVGLFLHMDEGTGFCGGSVLTNTYVLTAAHCIDTVSEATVIFGAHEINNIDEENQIRIMSSDFIIHERWIPPLIRNDVAMIRLADGIEYSETIQPVRLPSLSQASLTFEHELGTISGWGRFSDDVLYISPILRTVDAAIMTNDACGLRFPGIIQPSNICTSGSGRVGACSGDSGGPLTVTEDGVITQVGVVSFGVASGCERGWPSAFARVTFYLHWIAANSNVVLLE